MIDRRRVWRALPFVALLALLGPPAAHLGLTALRDASDREPTPPGWIDDASALERAPVTEVWSVPTDPSRAEAELAQLLRKAGRLGLPVAIAGARHSMGGHALSRGGLVIDMLPFHALRLDEGAEVLTVQAGALWSDVIPYLNARGRSVAIMQSNNSFSVGGSLSVNCHGWQPNRPPIASSVRGLRLLAADGRVVRCSRSENAELFSLVLGGYGLFGIILDADLTVVPNELYRPERFVTSSEEYADLFERQVASASEVGMAYGRLSVAPGTFLREGLLNVFHSEPGRGGAPSRLDFPESTALTRLLLRGQVGSAYGKRLRWFAERRLGGLLSGGTVARNQLLGEPVTVFDNRSAASTDILHEYFVPKPALAPFVDQVRRIVAERRGDLLNLTIRDVARDDDSFLRYAPEPMFALVMLFNQPRTTAGEAGMAALTRDLIDAALGLGGRYYLPYRLHATRSQFYAAYPQAERFFELKRRYDPQGLFRNGFYAAYGPGAEAVPALQARPAPRAERPARTPKAAP